GYSQTTYNDTIIALDQVEIHKKVRKPKIKKIVYGKNLNHFYVNYPYNYSGKQHFLIENFPFGEIIHLELFSFNYKTVTMNSIKVQNIIVCNPKKHTDNIYESLEENGRLSLGKLLFSKEYLLPPENAKFEYKTTIDLSEIKYRTDKFFIQLVSPLYIPKDCK